MHTRFKDKIAFHLSYPLSQSDLTEHLGEAINLLDIYMAFSSYKSPRKGEVRKKHVLVEATSPSHIISEWKLWIRPLPKEIRHFAKELLISEGLPILRDWFLSPKDSSWFISGHRISVIYVPETSVLAYDRKD